MNRRPSILDFCSICLLFSCATLQVFAQGALVFSTFQKSVDAPVSYLNGDRVGPEFTGQLFIGPAGTPASELQPLLPAVPFLSGSEQGYIFGGRVVVPNIPIGESATVVLRAFRGSAWETSECRGESEPITIPLSGGLEPDRELIGLQGFSVNCIPEPGTYILAIVGGVLILGSRRGKTFRS